MFNKLIPRSLFFPDKILQKNKVITEAEIAKIKTVILKLLSKNDDHIDNLNNPSLKHLINALVYAYRRPRCVQAIEYIIEKMENKINPQYFPAYNLVFMCTTSNFGLFKDSQMNIVSQLIFKKHESNLTDKEKQKCFNFLILTKEIYTISQIIKTNLELGQNPHIMDLYNIIDKFNELFRVLFNTKIFDIYRTLKPHKFARHSVAHAHFVIIPPKNKKNTTENEIIEIIPKMTIWERDPENRNEFDVKGFFEEYYNITLEDIRKDLICLSVFICQYLLFYQALKQIL